MTTNFEAGNKYRGRAVEWAMRSTPNTGTLLAAVLLEVTQGPLVGRRIRWQGYITDDAVQRTIEELGAMGWRANEFGRWDGIGSKEIEFSAMSDEGQDGKRFWRAAFVRPLQTLGDKNVAPPAAIQSATSKYARLLRPGGAPAAAPSNGAGDGFEHGDAYEPQEDPQQSL